MGQVVMGDIGSGSGDPIRTLDMIGGLPSPIFLVYDRFITCPLSIGRARLHLQAPAQAAEGALMPLKRRSCEWHFEDSWEGGLGSHKFCLVYQQKTGGFGDGRWSWTIKGMPHNTKVPLLGFSATAEEAKRAASAAFDVWLERSGLRIAPPA